MANEMHSILLVDYLTAAADIVDFAEYSNYGVIAESIGVHLIWGKLIISNRIEK